MTSADCVVPVRGQLVLFTFEHLVGGVPECREVAEEAEVRWAVVVAYVFDGDADAGPVVSVGGAVDGLDEVPGDPPQRLGVSIG